MSRAIWSGAISFGLVSIPVEVMSAKEEKQISFHMLDRRDNSLIGYKKINKSTGREVSAKDIVKGYEFEKGQFVTVTDTDFTRANPKATQTIDIEDFVDLDDVDILMFEKPYYLVPTKLGRKSYALLQKVLQKTHKVAMARVVMHQKQHLVAIIARGEYLILETLRFAHEVREVEEAEFLDEKEMAKVHISAQELKMAESLVHGMTSEWKPEKYKDTYQKDLKAFIEKKIKSGDTEEASETSAQESEVSTSRRNVIDLMPMLEQSLAATGRLSRGAKSKARARNGHSNHKSRA